ncbi:MAG: TlyA family RNA methyltransferase [Burkholderiaceae bacterium]
MIVEGAVTAIDPAGQAIVLKPATDLSPQVVFEVDPDKVCPFVSRGGVKLAGALDSSALDPRGMVCLDAGQSTGGFTDCLLARGATRVIGIDVGHDQLDPMLRTNRRVTAIEGRNLRDLDRPTLAALLGGTCPDFDLIVADLSFISLRLVLPALTALAASDTRMLALIKPQFEAGRAALDRHGVVRAESDHRRVRAEIQRAAQAAGWRFLGWHDSPITGGDGNREFFLDLRRAD